MKKADKKKLDYYMELVETHGAKKIIKFLLQIIKQYEGKI
jgi:hypothetical protein